jgi:hypothetical protein
LDRPPDLRLVDVSGHEGDQVTRQNEIARGNLSIHLPADRAADDLLAILDGLDIPRVEVAR